MKITEFKENFYKDALNAIIDNTNLKAFVIEYENRNEELKYIDVFEDEKGTLLKIKDTDHFNGHFYEINLSKLPKNSLAIRNKITKMPLI